MLLILAGITINYVLGEDGIIAQAKLAAERTRIANYQTVLEMIRASLELEEVLEDLTTEEFLNRYEEMAKKEAENGALKGADITRLNKGTTTDKVKVQTKEGDIFEITEEGIKYLGNINKGEIQETPELKETDITWDVSETKQTNGSVTVKIILTNPRENFTLQYAKKNKNETPTEEDWKEYKGETLIFTQNGNAFARLVNSLGDPGVHATKYVGNIDKLSPKDFNAQAEATTNSITIKGHTEDQEENEMYSKSKITKYYFKDITGIEDETSIKSSEGWQEETANETGDTSHTFLSLTPGKPYTFVMKAVDEAENETISSKVQISTKNIAVEEVTVTPQTAEIRVDGTVKLTATIEPSNATNKKLTWASDGEGIAQVTVNEDGTATVTGKGVGKANITVTAQDSTNKSATCTVTVRETNEIAKQYGIKQSTNKQVSDGSNGTNNKMWIPSGYTVLAPEKNENVSYKDNYNPQIDEGIVIADDEGNEFVWVPVDDINNMAMCQVHPSSNITFDETTEKFTCKTGATSREEPKLAGKLYSTSTNVNDFGTANTQYDANSGFREPAIVTGNNTGNGTSYDGDQTNLNNVVEGDQKTKEKFLEQLQNEFTEMAKSVAKYKGFYIGRYETSLSGEKSASKKGEDSLTLAKKNWHDQYKYNKEYAKGKSSVVSSTIWGSQYDAMMKWMQGNEINVISSNPKAGVEKNKTRITGSASKDKLCNIYDLLGNSREWTMEAYRDNERVSRGEGVNNYDWSPSIRGYYPPDQTTGYSSSRLSLYIK